MTSPEQLQQLINKQLAAVEFPAEPVNLYDPMRYMLRIGGKRMRPLLLLMAAELFDAKPEDAIHAACGIEVFHNFTLLHDDIMDAAPLRRTVPTVHAKWNTAIAILSGDAMFVKACQLVSSVPADVLPECLNLFFKTSLEVCEGQQMDMDFENTTSVSLDRYIEMIRLKTAVLLGCSLKSGAIIARANPEDADRLYSFGVNLGLAFQLQDDLLDVYGDTEKFGKQVGGDIRSNKKTFLLLSALENGSNHQREELQEWLHAEQDKADDLQKIEAVTAIYDALNIKGITEAKMQAYFDAALNDLGAVSVSDNRKEMLRAVTSQLMVRQA